MNFNSQIKDILSSLSIILESFENDTLAYIANFETKNGIFFTNNEESKKICRQKYKLFSIKIAHYIDECEKQISLISVLLNKADESCEKNLSENLANKFNNYIEFSNAITRFIKYNEALLSNQSEQFKISNVITSARELLCAIRHYNSKIKDSILSDLKIT